MKFIFEGRGNDLLSLLKEDYVRESALAAHLKAHAENMPYDFYRDQLVGLARMSEEGAELLGTKIRAMGSGLPEVPEPEPMEGNLWEKLVRDVDEQNRLYYRYLSQAGVDGDDELRELLDRLRRDKDEQISIIQRLLSGLHGYSL